MDGIAFEWDDRKSRANVKKHGLSFAEAQGAFLDEFAQVFSDPDHSVDEERYILLGMTAKLRIIVVCHCLRLDDAVIRIISARKALRAEAQHYWRRRT